MSAYALNRRALLGRSLAGAIGLGGLPAALMSSPVQAHMPPAPPPPDEVTPAERTAMRQLAQNFMNRYDVPALSFAIGHYGANIYQDALGWAVRAEGTQPGQAVTPNNLFRIASVSKPITSVAIFSLIAQGRLHLSDKVFGPGGSILGTDYGWPPYDQPVNGRPYHQQIDQITVEHLLTHTCGGWSNNGNDPMFQNPQMSQAELIRWVLAMRPLNYTPGTHYAYSNFGYCVLGRVIEKLTRQSYADYVRYSVLGGCGVNDMVIAGNTLAQRKPNEVEYYAQNGENPYTMNVTRMDSHGGWLARPADLVQFFMRIGGVIPGSDFLAPNLIEVMTTASDVSVTQCASPAAKCGPYAKGWAVVDAAGSGWHAGVPHNWWHDGSLPGTSTIAVRTSTGFCWAGFTNTSRNGLHDNPGIGTALDTLMWSMVRSVAAWRPHV